jgi:hypothetical protein
VRYGKRRAYRRKAAAADLARRHLRQMPIISFNALSF